MSATFASPGEAIVAGLLVHMSQLPWIREMAEANDEERFVMGCQQPRFEVALVEALLDIRDTLSSHSRSGEEH